MPYFKNRVFQFVILRRCKCQIVNCVRYEVSKSNGAKKYDKIALMNERFMRKTYYLCIRKKK